jgi:hypothetical protein
MLICYNYVVTTDLCLNNPIDGAAAGPELRRAAVMPFAGAAKGCSLRDLRVGEAQLGSIGSHTNRHRQPRGKNGKPIRGFMESILALRWAMKL